MQSKKIPKKIKNTQKIPKCPPPRGREAGAPNHGYLLNALKTLFRLSRVLSNLYKCILSGAIKLYLFGRPMAT